MSVAVVNCILRVGGLEVMILADVIVGMCEVLFTVDV